MKKLIPSVLAAALLTAGCSASYENRIASRLADAGLARPMASCMAARMVDRLSTSQLKQIARFGKGLDRDVKDMTVGEVTRRFAAIGDPEIIEVMARAGLGCAIAGG